MNWHCRRRMRIGHLGRRTDDCRLDKPVQTAQRGDTAVAENLEEAAPAEPSQTAGAAMGGDMASMSYYMSNPELMKRYFPQLYAQMQKGRETAGGIAGGAGGMP